MVTVKSLYDINHVCVCLSFFLFFKGVCTWAHVGNISEVLANHEFFPPVFKFACLFLIAAVFPLLIQMNLISCCEANPVNNLFSERPGVNSKCLNMYVSMWLQNNPMRIPVP